MMAQPLDPELLDILVCPESHARLVQVDDWLYLREWHPDNETYTGQAAMVRVTHVTRGPDFAVPEGFAVLTIQAGMIHYNTNGLDTGSMTGGQA